MSLKMGWSPDHGEMIMAECYLCEKRMWSWKNVDGHKFCSKCVRQWPSERKKRALNGLFAEDGLKELFTIQDVSNDNVDHPPSMKESVGELIFMNRGICFVQLAGFRTFEGILGPWFAPIVFIDEWRRRKARRRAGLKRSEHTSDEGEDTLRRRLNEAERLLFFPVGEIQNISGTGVLMIEINNIGEQFVFPRRKKTFREYEGRIFDYWSQAKRGEEIQDVREEPRAFSWLDDDSEHAKDDSASHE